MTQGRRAWLIAGTLLLPVSGALAQTTPPPPSRPLLDTTTITPQIAPPPAAPRDVPRVEVPALPPVNQPQGAEQLRFRLDSLRIDGATAIDAATLNATYAGLIGREVSVADLYATAAAITGLYRERGYVLSRAVVPAQTIETGEARITVVEGYIAEVRIEGTDGPIRARLDGYLRQLEGLRPVRVADLERYLLLANDLPGMKVKGVLRPIAGQPGAAALIVETEHDPFAGFATVNNRGSRELGPWSGAVQVGVQSLTAAGEELHVLGYSSLFDWREQRYYEVGGSLALGNEGTRLGASASYGPSYPGGVLIRPGAEAESTRIGIDLTHPFIRTRALSLWGLAGYGWIKSETAIAGFATTRERVAEVYLGAKVESTDSWDGFNRGELRLRRGIKGLGGGVDQTTLATPDGDPDFTAINAEVSRRQPLGGMYELYGKIAGQYSPDSLLSPARIKFGGQSYLRGYTGGELGGDSGVAYSLEARIQDRPSWADLTFIQGYVFLEQGWAWNAAGSSNLASTGIGVRVLPRDWLIVELELAQGLKDGFTGADRGEKPTRLYLTSTVRF